MRKTSPIRILVSDSHNPWFNLATEDWIFHELEGGTQILFLWRNADTVVIGRNQNPWSECNLQRMQSDEVILARRTSGGGAVFQDLGNTCFTFLSPREGYSKNQNIEVLLAALKKLGIHAEASGRNDLVIAAEDGPRKISGSAYRETQKKAFHHGTFLISTDLSRLANYLTPHPKKLASKGRASVRARVMNLCEIVPSLTHEVLTHALVEAFCEFHGNVAEPEMMDSAWLKNQPSLQKMFEQFSSWEWRFGHAPHFQHQMTESLSWGLFTVHVDCEEARITRARIDSDALFPEIIESFQVALVGRPYTRAGVREAVLQVQAEAPQLRNELGELGDWLETQVEV